MNVTTLKRSALCALLTGLAPLWAGAETANAPVPPTRITIGDPSKPGDLSKELLAAYDKGARDITIAKGTYVLPAIGANSISLPHWSNTVVHADGVTMIFKDLTHRPVCLNQCDQVTLAGATLRFVRPAFTQGRIKAMGKDGKGNYLDWQIDAGYPTEFDVAKSMLDVADQKTRLIKVGTGDCGSGLVDKLAPGLFRLHGVNGGLGKAEVNDWLFTRVNGGSSIVQLDGCGHCTMRRLNLQNAGFAAFFETGGGGANTYEGCRVMPGPRPEGAPEDQLVGCGADGFHSTGTKIGPTIDRCSWEGLLHDDCIAIHGSFTKVVRAEGKKLILDGNRSGFAAGEPVRISSDKGYFGEFTCTSVRPIKERVDYLELTLHRRGAPPVTMIVKKGSEQEFSRDASVKISNNKGGFDNFTCKEIRTIARSVEFTEVTLDRESGAPSEAKASNPKRNGAGFKILNCTLGNCRSRGILVKADDGLIEGCTISGCGMSAISIGPEYWWGESDYSRKVTVKGNKLISNGVNGNSAIVFIHGDGAIGNANIAIAENLFDRNYGNTAVYVEDTDGAAIDHNRFIASSVPLPKGTRTICDFKNSKNIALRGNTVESAAPGDTMVALGKNVEGVTGNDCQGITAGPPR